MTSTINASTTAGIVQTADTSGVLALQGAGTSILTGSAGNTLALQGATSGTGCGIAFPATQVASSNANTLDDYEEGTFTPFIILTGSAPTINYANQSGLYVKIGSLVYFSVHISINTVSGGSGTLAIDGLPFVSSNLDLDGYQSISTGYQANWASSQVPVSGLVFINSTYFRPYYMASIGGNKIDMTQAALGNSIDAYFAGCYRTA